MSDRPDEEGFHPHPGDPWHPEWTEESVPEETTAEASFDDRPRKTRRGLFRRKPKDTPEFEDVLEGESAAVAPEPADDAWAKVSETVLGDDQSSIAVDSPGVEGAADDDTVVIASVPEAAPTPAWLSDVPAGFREDSTPAVGLPSWEGDTTVGAGAEIGGFEPAGRVDDDEMAEGSMRGEQDPSTADLPVAEDLEVALKAIGALDDDVDVVSVGDLDDQRSLFDGAQDVPRTLTPLDPSPEIAAAASEYGVAGKEAFEALRDIHDEDLGEWGAFAEADPVAPRRAAEPDVGLGDLPGLESLQPDAFDEWVAEESPRRRGVWPFRRRQGRGEGDEILDEPAEWVGDAAQVPRGWFAEVDEDAVVPPPADLPETEWLELEPPSHPESALPLATEPGGWEVPTGAGRVPPPTDGFDSGDALEADDVGVPDEPTTPSKHSAPITDDSRELSVEFDHGYGFDALPEIGEPLSAYDTAGGSEPDDAMFRPPGERRPPRRPEPPVGDLDDAEDEGAIGYEEQWVTGPIDLGEGYDADGTVELPSAYASVDDITEQVYTTSATMEHRGFAEELVRAGEEDTEWQAISAAMPGVGTGVVGFDDVADLGDDEDVYEAPARSELGTRAITGIVLIGFLIGSVWVGGAAAAVFIGLLVVLGLGEFYGTLRRRGFRPLSLFGYLGSVGLFAATWFHGPIAIPAAAGLTAIMVFFVYSFAPMRREALANGGLTLLGVVWVVGTAAFAVPILRAEHYKVLVLAIVVTTAAMDIGAYSAGRTWGRRALAPILSPNKSVEGLIGGVVACMAAAAAFGRFVEPFDLTSGIALGVVICFAAPVGDLAESMLKRSLGVKDMGAVLPGHGGILDRVDAFLFVLPAAWVLLQTIGLLG
ncbi:MAG TPA: phosphatidate cytidylyltransferase [Acidimicrobiia bacterium]|nr:phosphatidate cytidylyltransferase [Acidimicrobiia bacterium]